MAIAPISDVFIPDTATNRAVGAQTESVDIPAGSNYALISMGCWAGGLDYNPSLNPISLDGVPCSMLAHRTYPVDGDGTDSYIFGVELGPANEGTNKTFAWTNNVAVQEGGVIHFQFLSGVGYTNTLVDSGHDGGFTAPTTYSTTVDVVASGHIHAMTCEGYDSPAPTWSGVDLVGSQAATLYKKLTIGGRAQVADDTITVEAIGVSYGSLVVVSLRSSVAAVPDEVIAEFNDSAITTFAPIVEQPTQVSAQFNDSAIVTFAVEVQQPAQVQVEFNDSAIVTFAPVVEQPTQISVEFNDSEIQTFQLEVTQAGSVNLEFNDSTIQTFLPIVEQPVAVDLAFNDSAIQTFELEVIQVSGVTLEFNDQTIQTFLLLVQQPVPVELEFNDSAIQTFPVFVETGSEINLLFNDSEIQTFPVFVEQAAGVELEFNDSAIATFPLLVEQPAQVVAAFNDSEIITFPTTVSQPTGNVTLVFNDSKIVTFETIVSVGILKRFFTGRTVVIGAPSLNDRAVIVTQ